MLEKWEFWVGEWGIPGLWEYANLLARDTIREKQVHIIATKEFMNGST